MRLRAFVFNFFLTMKRCGIIGGLGPSATVDLYKLIIKHTPARRDQDHIRVIIDSNAQIPDRTAALLYKGESPVPYLLDSIRILQNSEVDFIVCPCNTAHVFLRRLKDQIKVPFIDMIEETVIYLQENKIPRAGLLSTEGTAKSLIYQETGKKYGIEILIPSEEGIKNVMNAISGPEGIKAGVKFEKSKRNKTLLLDTLKEFEISNINHVIMGCTEIPLCIEKADTSLELINPAEILAKEVVRYSLKL